MTAGSAGTTGSSAGTTGNTGGTATTGTAGTTVATGRGGTTGAAGRGGSGGSVAPTGGAGTTGAGGAGQLFADNFESGASRWNFAGIGTSMLASDGSQVFSLNETAGDQYVGAAGSTSWTNQVVEARVKVLAFNGNSSSDVAAICARLTDPDHFYYFAIQADGRAKIKVNNGGNSSIGSSINIPGGFALNTWYTMRLSVVGSTLTAYINGTMVGQETDASLTAGAVGLLVQRTSASFDDVVVRSP